MCIMVILSNLYGLYFNCTTISTGLSSGFSFYGKTVSYFLPKIIKCKTVKADICVLCTS